MLMGFSAQRFDLLAAGRHGCDLVGIDDSYGGVLQLDRVSLLVAFSAPSDAHVYPTVFQTAIQTQ